MSIVRTGVALTISALGFLPFACGGKVVELAANDGGVDGASTTPTETGTTTPTTTATPTSPPASSCPPKLPAPDAPCVPSVKCGYGCEGGMRGEALCATDHWEVTKIGCSAVGQACTHSDECDLDGSGTNFCGADSFVNGPLSPTPTCLAIDCTPSEDGSPSFCAGRAGVCVASSTDGLCLGACRFDSSEKAPTGCLGKDSCNAVASRMGPEGLEGFGYCIGGCRADGDCPAGSACQLDARLCLKTVNALPKKQDEPCKVGESTATLLICACLTDRTTLAGYCANACSVGEDCGPAHVCDPMLPPSFTTLPKGLAGSCLKTCTTDAACPGGTVCKQSGGLKDKTCQPLHPSIH